MSEKLNSNISLDRAIEIATNFHKDQVDRAGQPYINHPLSVMNKLEGEEVKIVAVLHDTIEDTPLTYEDLRIMGCSEEVLCALELVTHSPSYSGSEEEYMEKIRAIADSGNQLAIDVKWADLTHNSVVSRIPNPSDRDFRRWDKYRMSKDVLRPFVSSYLLNGE